MPGADVRTVFAQTGVVRLNGAFSAEAARRISDAVWRYAERKAGLRRDDPTSWRGGWPGISWKGLKRNPVFAPVLANEAVGDTLDAVFGTGGWQVPKPGAQMLFTLPGPQPWVLPDAWHMDSGFERPSWPAFGVKLFAFFDEVGPEGGGTMILPGTHLVVDHYRRQLPAGTGAGMANWRPFLRHHPFLAQLLQGKSLPDGGRSLVGAVGDVNGIPVAIEELTGQPGDVVITHLHVFHTVSPNVSAVPRQMLGKAVYAAAPASRQDGHDCWSPTTMTNVRTAMHSEPAVTRQGAAFAARPLRAP